ncbi:enoyl-CoA hydratase/carnithine racemase [Raoultella sp. BIGb0138]|uniref:enoyl-CoA hydratase/isomerase family protein n=1 Tax=Raoultella sp. BIGb0138 TaxID=2485115 RepID=UPI00104D10C8|nr:enoyl-CoA hydratase-related protein [Raoultella sp. BIGb0138]TCW06498.1 enoyl-CoA hydratase/carnithine racemase [Raoultella sp. BIGb0138]
MLLINCERQGAVAVVTLNNPPLNLVTLSLSKQLRATLQSLDADDEVRVIVLTGSGHKAFCVGSDIKEFPEVWDNVIEKKLQKENETFNTIEFLNKPVIAAMEGVVCGGGFEMAMACDLRVLSDSGKIALPEINLGVFPGSGGLFRLPKLIGAARAVELMMTGTFVEAQQCIAWGMVNRLAPAGTVLEAAVSLAQEIALKPREAIKLIKRGVREIGMQPTEQCFLQNLRFSENIFRTVDCAEGVAAFLEKREAKFL